MINHARTLLLNLPSSSAAIGEEYVPRDFVPIKLPAHLDKIRTILLGKNRDRPTVNFKVRQYLQILHSTEFSYYLYNLDPRITYDLRSKEFFDLSGQLSVGKLGETEDDLFVLGSYNSKSNTPVSNLLWRVTIDSATEVTVKKQFAPASTETVEYTSADGLSSAIRLPGTMLTVRFNTREDDSHVGNSWRIELNVIPDFDLGDTWLSLKSAGDDVLSQVFKYGAEEPYASFERLWHRSKQLHYSLSGLLLAYVYGVNDLIGSPDIRTIPEEPETPQERDQRRVMIKVLPLPGSNGINAMDRWNMLGWYYHGGD